MTTNMNIRVYGAEPEAIIPNQPTIIPMRRASDRRDPKKPKPGPTLRQVYERHVRPILVAKTRAKSTIRDIERALDRWEEYWSAPLTGSSSEPDGSVASGLKPRGERILNPFPSGTTEQVAKTTQSRTPLQLRVRKIKRRHLEEFQIHMQTATSRLGKPFSKSSINKDLGSIRQILCAAESHALLKLGRPRVEKLPAKPAPKYYVSRDQMNALWEKCDASTWPRLPGLTTGQWWRCALTMMWMYGFRTQELLAFQKGKVKLTWSCIHFGAETPNPAGQAANPLGWLVYVPQKQKWAKPEPLHLPLTVHTRAVVDWLAAAARTQCHGELPADRPLFPWSSSHRSLYSQWESIQQRAKVATKSGAAYDFKHLRKSAATYLEGHWPGLGEAVVGWADRDAQVQVSKVMKDHYAVDEHVLVDKLATYPVPDCFAQLLDAPSMQMLLFE